MKLKKDKKAFIYPLDEKTLRAIYFKLLGENFHFTLEKNL